MRSRLNWMTLLVVGLLAMPAVAQTPEKPADKPPAGDPAMKQKLLDNFDTNKDGTLDRTERREIGRAIWENFGGGPGDRGPGDRGQGNRGQEGRRRPDGPPPGGGQGPAGQRGRGPDGPPPGPGGRGPESARRGGPDGRPPNPERLFNRFDEDKDGSLSKDEFKALTDFMRENRPMGPPMMDRGGPGRGFDGPPPRGDFQRRDGEGRRRGRREGPPGPPPGPEGPPPPADPPASDAPEDSI
jgi:hypothetical protein